MVTNIYNNIYMYMVIVVTTNYTFGLSKIFRLMSSSIYCFRHIITNVRNFTVTYKFIMKFNNLMIFTTEL